MTARDTGKIKGVVVPVLTPLTEQEEVAVPELAKLVNHLIDGGVHGLFPLGTSGEFARLTEEQKEQVMRTTMEANAGRLPVYMGISDTGTKRVLQHLRKAEEWGADVVVATLPYYFPVRDPREQLQFFEAVCSSTDLPVMLYNIPATVGAGIHAGVAERMFERENVVGIKDSSGDLDYVRQCVTLGEASGRRVLVGDESISAAGLAAGAHGLVPSLANVFPKLLVQLFDAAGSESELSRLQEEMNAINALNRTGESWLGPIILRKKLLSLMDIGSERLTEPALPLDAPPEKLQQLKDWIEQYA